MCGKYISLVVRGLEMGMGKCFLDLVCWIRSLWLQQDVCDPGKALGCEWFRTA